MTSPPGAICPRCGQRAPIVLRGLGAACTVCGAPRTPFAAPALNLAGRPARFGGFAAGIFGWALMVLGLAVSLMLGLAAHTVGQAVFGPQSLLGLAFGVPVALVTLALSTVLLLGGRKLRRSGDAAERAAQLQTIRALAEHRQGTLTAADAARALSVAEAQADALLTELAKDPDADVSLELDAEGRIRYLFGAAERDGRWRDLAARQARIDAEAAAQPQGEHEAQAEAEAEAAAEAEGRRRAGR
ncbi:MAG: hypothetical protein HY744_23485 [Deltaproteobacteria bacterium]|nr:hypothetical protein [Deltaproteobacteria bacterium]